MSDAPRAVGRPAKYTYDFCLSEIRWMIDFLRSPEGSRVNLLFQLCTIRGYSGQRFSEWVRYYFDRPDLLDNEEFSESVLMIKEILFSRVLQRSMVSELMTSPKGSLHAWTPYNAGMAKLIIDNNYVWPERKIQSGSEEPKKSSEAESSEDLLNKLVNNATEKELETLESIFIKISQP